MGLKLGTHWHHAKLSKSRLNVHGAFPLQKYWPHIYETWHIKFRSTFLWKEGLEERGKEFQIILKSNEDCTMKNVLPPTCTSTKILILQTSFLVFIFVRAYLLREVL